MTFGLSGTAIAALVGAAGAVGGAAISAKGAKSAAKTQADAAGKASAQYQENVQPYLDAGQSGITNVQAAVQPGGLATQRFTMADAINSPAEKYAMDQMMQATQNSAASRGGLLTTNTNQELQKNAAGIASQYEGQAFNQWNQQQQQELLANQNLASMGVNAATGNANNVANATLAAGGANAGAQVSNANTLGGTVAQLGNILGQAIPGITGNTGSWGAQSMSGISPVNTGGITDTGLLTSDPGLFSDERLKEDITEVGKTHDGLPIYTFRMKSGGPKQMGIMAQDMERMKPGAVTRDARTGFRMVDYGKVS